MCNKVQNIKYAKSFPNRLKFRLFKNLMIKTLKLLQASGFLIQAAPTIAHVFGDQEPHWLSEMTDILRTGSPAIISTRLAEPLSVTFGCSKPKRCGVPVCRSIGLIENKILAFVPETIACALTANISLLAI